MKKKKGVFKVLTIQNCKLVTWCQLSHYLRKMEVHVLKPLSSLICISFSFFICIEWKRSCLLFGFNLHPFHYLMKNDWYNSKNSRNCFRSCISKILFVTLGKTFFIIFKVSGSKIFTFLLQTIFSIIRGTQFLFIIDRIL